MKTKRVRKPRLTPVVREKIERRIKEHEGYLATEKNPAWRQVYEGELAILRGWLREADL